MKMKWNDINNDINNDSNVNKVKKWKVIIIMCVMCVWKW